MDCVRKQSAGMRMARTAFGGLAVGDRPSRVSQVLIGLCAVAYVLQILPGSTVTTDFAFSPVLALVEPWRVLTAAFLHSPSSPLHILFNMYVLWTTGPYLEAQLGRVRFAVLYLLSAVGGSVFFLLLTGPLTGSWFGGTVGASGAVFGLFGAFFVVQQRLNRDVGPLLAVIAILFAFGFLQANVAWQAHLGGLVTGALAAGALAYAPRANRTLIQVAGLSAVAVLLALIFLAKVASVSTNVFY